MLQDATRRERIDLALLRRWREHDDVAARDELVRRCVPLVRSFARKYAGRGESMEDLEQVGMVGLVKAIARFRLDGGHRFISYAIPNITGEMRRHFRDHTWSVHVPRSMQELDATLQSTRRALRESSGHEPTDDDLAAELELPVERVREATVAGRAYRTHSLDHPAGEDGVVADTKGAVDPGYAQVERRDVLREAMEVLDDRERTAVRMRYRDERLQREIAAEIGVSQMQVSRILGRAQERMRRHVADRGPDPVAA